jgi:hypothetical protein
MKKRILLIALIGMSLGLKAQNPTAYIAEKTDNTSATFNLKNTVGFWHLSGPRSYEANNPFAIYWYNGSYHRYFNILDNGNVGIGTSNPSAKLEIKASGDGVEILKLSTERPWVFKQEGTGASSNLVLQELSGSKFFKIKSVTNEDVYWLHSSTGDSYLKGKLGIGTTTPSAKLDVNGNVKASSFSVIGANYNSILSSNILQFSRDGFSYIDNEKSNGSIAIRTGGTDNVDFLVKSNGNIGIGTTNPNGWKLAVNGQIRAKEIKVETGWSDFVFYDDYKLPTLKEVENHIKEKGHLKDIPSAKEVKKNGILLGEMDAKLLRKIEELTLYTINQQKEIENLKNKNSKLLKVEKENESLATKFFELQKRLEKLEKK